MHLGAMVKMWTFGVRMDTMTDQFIPAVITSSVLLAGVLGSFLFVIQMSRSTGGRNFGPNVTREKNSEIPSEPAS